MKNGIALGLCMSGMAGNSYHGSKVEVSTTRLSKRINFCAIKMLGFKIGAETCIKKDIKHVKLDKFGKIEQNT